MPEETTPSMLSRMLTLHDASDVLQVSIAHLRREIRARRLAVHRLGRNIRISADDLAAYVNSRRRAPR